MAKEEKNLQSAFEQLEKIVDDLGEKDIDIEASLEKFKEGVSLIKFCQEQLKKAENEFEKLRKEIEVEENEKEKEESTNSEEIPF